MSTTLSEKRPHLFLSTINFDAEYGNWNAVLTLRDYTFKDTSSIQVRSDYPLSSPTWDRPYILNPDEEHALRLSNTAGKIRAVLTGPGSLEILVVYDPDVGQISMKWPSTFKMARPCRRLWSNTQLRTLSTEEELKLCFCATPNVDRWHGGNLLSWSIGVRVVSERPVKLLKNLQEISLFLTREREFGSMDMKDKEPLSSMTFMDGLNMDSSSESSTDTLTDVRSKEVLFGPIGLRSLSLPMLRRRTGTPPSRERSPKRPLSDE